MVIFIQTMRAIVLLFLVTHSWAQTVSDKIRLNQIGFYPNSPKVAVVVGSAAGEFTITKPNDNLILFKGSLGELKQSSYNSKQTRIADFSSFQSAGTFVLRVAGVGASYPFTIKSNVHQSVLKAAIKSYYYQRFSMPLEKKFAGQWSRPASANQPVVVHASAASPQRPTNTSVPSPKGWIDAGDYNKYIVNSGITTATLLACLEDFAPLTQALDLSIPESNNKLPDLLDEILWNLRWMLTMQDLNDGGVYHKCTNANFDAMVMPHEPQVVRYLVQKSTAAALDFTAVMAQASKILQAYNVQLPGLADSCWQAAQRAWTWAKANPAVIYDQNKINQQFDPDITTGTYGDGNITDEWIWAAATMAAMSGDITYISGIEIFPDAENPVPAWNQVRLLGYYALGNAALNTELKTQAQTRIIEKANELLAYKAESPYEVVMGKQASDFVWGSNAVAANQSMLLLQAYRITQDIKFRDGALANLDYLLGRNGTGYSFVTGHGSKTPKHIHHRPSEADGVAEPIPGLLAGGPNPSRQDKCKYSSTLPDEAYVDDVCSYASNEVAINWNAPLVYIIAAMELYCK